MDTKQIINKLISKHKTNNPFIIADNLGITILHRNMKNTLGFFSKYNRFKFIHLNDNAPEKLQTFVCAHELGHGILHPNVNTPFLKRHTLYSTSRIEREANAFAVELILTDEILEEYYDCSVYALAKHVGIPDKLVDLKTLPNLNRKLNR